MANTDIANGFKPVKALDGGPMKIQYMECYVPSTDSTAIYIGAPVKFAGSADARGIPTMTLASSGDAVAGVMMGRSRATRDDKLYREASVSQYIFIAPIRDLQFEVQEDSDGNALAATAVGSNIDFAGSGGSTTTGHSAIEIDSDTAANTNTLDCQILALVNRDDNEIGTNAKWLVRFNDIQFANQIAGTTE